LNGLGGNDALDGGNGNDTLDGGLGTDSLLGGAGDEIYKIAESSGLDTITDTSGNDRIVRGAGITKTGMSLARDAVKINDLNISFAGVKTAVVKNHFAGTGNIETLQFSDGSTFNLLTNYFTLTGTTGANTLTGHAGSDKINGGAGNDTLYGGAGNDCLYGEAGSDTLRGEAGDDNYVFDGGLDKIYETAGTDVLRPSAAMTIEALVISDVGTVDTKLTFNAGMNEITLYGQHGTDANLKVESAAFADGFKADLLTYKSWAWGATTAQTTNGTANADTILGRGGNDTINGAAGNNALHGGSGNDTFDGDAGNDNLYGDDGLDKLYGGAGADIFVFQKDTAYKNIDVINDFKTAELDKINVADILEGYNPATKAITDFVQITTSGTNSLLYVDKDGGANGFVQVATISGATGLTDETALMNSGLLIAA